MHDLAPQAVFDALADAIVVAGGDGKIWFVNASAERLLGRSAAQLVGESLAVVLPGLSGGDLGRTLSLTLPLPGGDARHLEVTLGEVRDNAGERLTVAALRDLAGRREREQVARVEAEEARGRLALLAEAGAVLGASLDYRTTLASLAQLAVPTLADWCVVDVLDAKTKRFRRHAVAHSDPAMVELGWELERRFPSDVSTPDGPAAVVRTGAPQINNDVAELLRDAPLHPDYRRILSELGIHSYMGVPLTARGVTMGAITFVLGESRRHYDERDLELALELARRASVAIDNALLYDEAQTAIRARDVFLAIASHELKTPLTALQLKVQSLLRSARSGSSPNLVGRMMESLETANRQIQRLGTLVNNLLDISRITAGRLALSLDDEVDLVVVAREVAARMEEEATRAGCRVTLTAPPAAVLGRWDRTRLEQVTSNLLSNAAKYGRGKPISLAVDAGHGQARLSVSDEGIGIADEDQARIFERFERAVSERHYGGFGLGLWIVRQIVEAHGGTIAVRSQIGNGSTFLVTLPQQSVVA